MERASKSEQGFSLHFREMHLEERSVESEVLCMCVVAGYALEEELVHKGKSRRRVEGAARECIP